MVLAYGSGKAADSITNYLLTTLLLFYYTSVLGLSGELAGLALMVGLLFDAVTDPLVAAMSDRTRSRWGRRHPYILASLIPLGGGLVLAFQPPPFVTGQAGLFAWLLLVAVLIRAALTLLDVPHLALGAELTPEYDERTRVVMVRNLVGMVGTAGIALLYYVSFDAYRRRFPEAPDVRLMTEPYEMFGLIAGIACAVFIVITVVGTRHAIPWLVEPRSGEKAGSLIAEAFRDLAGTLRLPAFRALVLVVTLVTMASGFIPLMQTHLAVYFWHVDVRHVPRGAGDGHWHGLLAPARGAVG